MDQKVYQRNGKGCWVRVRRHNDGARGYRASTNDEPTYWLISAKLDFQRTFDEAQNDLDQFAIRHNLTEVKDPSRAPNFL